VGEITKGQKVVVQYSVVDNISLVWARCLELGYDAQLKLLPDRFKELMGNMENIVNIAGKLSTHWSIFMPSSAGRLETSR